jgi:hypothetical protein
MTHHGKVALHRLALRRTEKVGDTGVTLGSIIDYVTSLEGETGRLQAAARDVIASASDTYKKRNGHLGSFEDDSGEKCWVVPFDAFESLRSAVDAITTKGGAV